MACTLIGPRPTGLSKMTGVEPPATLPRLVLPAASKKGGCGGMNL
jgi:hypothetical protein